MDQNGNPTADMWEVPSSSSPVTSGFGNEGFIEETIKIAPASPASNTMRDTIRVASPLPSGFMGPSILQSNSLNCLDAAGMVLSSPQSESMNLPTSQSNPTYPMNIPYSPTYSSSSLSEPPTEPNSPILFHIKLEAAEDNFNSPSEAMDHNSTSTNLFTIPPGSSTRTRISGSRGVDPCADEVWVAALRVAHAADQMEGISDDPIITHSRNLRRTSGRLNRVSNASSVTRSPICSTPLNGTPKYSKKRSRSNIRSHLNNTASGDSIMVIKSEMFETGGGGVIESSIPFSPLTEPRRRRNPPAKKRKADSAPVAVPELVPGPHDSHTNEGKESTNIPSMGGTAPLRKRKKRPKRLTYTYVTELVESKPDDGTRGSVPPNFTFRYATPHTPFSFEKEPPPSSGYWSEGAKGPGNFKPIGDVFKSKDGLLTDAVSIVESRLRPRKSTGYIDLETPQHRKSRGPRESLNLGSDPGHEPEAGSQPEKLTKKRTLDDRSSEGEESSDDDRTDIEDEDLGENDDMDLEIDSEDTDQSVSMEGDTPENSPTKRQKPNAGEGSFTGAIRKTLGKGHPNNQSKQVTARKDIDERTWDGAISLVEGKYMVPNCCTNCKEARQFCNRNFPCSNCVARGKDCHRPPGLQPARVFARRGLGRKALLDGISSPTPKIKKVWAKKEVGNKVKKEKEIKVKKERDTKDATIINLIDPQEGKPPGIRRPDVWCESRQELCESLPYYRSYQSGCYGHDGLVHGYLLDGFAAPRDYVDGKIVISHSGGKSTADEDGQRRLLTNQTPEDKVIKYLLANMKNQLPLVMIMGTQCASSPSKLPHRYCVMDWFKVTAGWAERDPRSRFTRWKFRFEKLDTTIDGWWAASPTVEYDTPTDMVKASCNSCKTESPHIYEEGWMCLKADCVVFWTLNGKDAPVDMKYTNNFLRCRTPWPTEFLTAPNPLGPPLNFNRDVFFDGGDVSRVFWKGMCCPKCGRLNCREFWAGWRCLSCDFRFDPPRTTFDASRLADPHRPVFTGPAIPANMCHDDISYERYVRDGMTVIQYQLGDCGTVTHILANQKINARPMEADWLFREYQSADMPFKRYILGNHKAQGRLLTQQFTFNCGAPYKFIVDVESHPFENSPPVVSRALEVIHDRVNLVHPEAQFNEVLNVGYFEKQKMDYHDDGEVGLGETVASISLGAPARMRFRIKAKYSRERHCWTTRPATPLQHRLAESLVKEEPKNDEGLDVGDEEDDEDPERNEEVIGGQQPTSPPGRSPKKLYKGRVKLDLCLSHGDVMVMKGRDIQKYWEHSVIPQGLFRIAATARFISENHPGVLNKAKAENGEAENSAKTPKREYKLASGSRDGSPPSFEEALILENLASPEFTQHLNTAPIQIAPTMVTHDYSQQESVHVGSNEGYPQVQQPDTFDSDSMDWTPEVSLTIAPQNADQVLSQEAPGNFSREENGNKLPRDSNLEHPIPPPADRTTHMVSELPYYNTNATVPGCAYSHPPLANRPGAIFPNTQPGQCDNTNTTRNPFSNPTPILPQLSIGISGTLNQGPPRFGTANILHPMNQLTSPSDITLFPCHMPETVAVNPQHVLRSQFDQKDSTPVQLMPIVSNMTRILHRIPGLTTLWPEMGNIGVPVGQISEDPAEMSNI